MNARPRVELEARLAHHLKEQVEQLAATVDIHGRQARLERRLRPIQRRRRPLYLSAIALAMTAAALTVAVLVGRAGNGRDVTVPATNAPSTTTTFTSEISPLPGLRFTWPTGGWRAVDAPAEVVVRPPGVPGALIRVSKGLYPTDPSGAFVTTRTSAVSVIGALLGLPALKASAPVREHLGDGLAAIRVDIRLSASAPRLGFSYLGYRGNSVNAAAYTITTGMRVRVYAAVYHAPYGNDLLDIVVEAPNGREFAQATALADRALQSLRLPKGLVAGRTFHL